MWSRDGIMKPPTIPVDVEHVIGGGYSVNPNVSATEVKAHNDHHGPSLSLGERSAGWPLEAELHPDDIATDSGSRR